MHTKDTMLIFSVLKKHFRAAVLAAKITTALRDVDRNNILELLYLKSKMPAKARAT